MRRRVETARWLLIVRSQNYVTPIRMIWLLAVVGCSLLMPTLVCFRSKRPGLDRTLRLGLSQVLKSIPIHRTPIIILCLAPAAMAQDLVFERQVEPFPVLDLEGTPYALPFTGGMDSPRPQLIDIDADGDLDLFIQRNVSTLAFFEHTGSPQTARYTWQTDAFQDLDIGLWYRFSDIDADGDFDLIGATENQLLFGMLRVFLNEGTPQAPDFGPGSAPLLNTTDGTPIASGLNLPALADIDCDGDSDVFFTTPDGRISFYTHDGLNGQGLPRFTFVTNTLQDIVIVSVGKTADEGRHGIGTLRFFDRDADGDLDMFWADEFTSGLYLFDNIGSCDAPNFLVPANDADFVRFPQNAPIQTSGFNIPEWGDLNGDGHTDLLVGIQSGFAGMVGTDRLETLYFYTQASDGSFSRETTTFLSDLDLGEDTAPAMADLDDDGDLDLLIGNKQSYAAFPFPAQLAYLENTGTPTAPAFVLREPDFLPLEEGIFNAAPALADLDADGDADLILGDFQGDLHLFRNTGTPAAPVFTPEPEALADLNVGNLSAPTLADLDHDGDLDLLVGNNRGTLTYFENTGTPAVFQFENQTDPFAHINLEERSTPTLADLDADGDLDLMVGGTDTLVVFRNTGTAQAAAFTPDETLGLPVAPQGHPALADLNQDRRPDLLLGTTYGGLMYAQNLTQISSATEEDIPQSLALLETYPNPFRDHVQVSYRIPPGRMGHLTLYNMLGQQLRRWPLESSSGTVVWHGELPGGIQHTSGMYLLRLSLAGGEAIQRLFIRQQ